MNHSYVVATAKKKKLDDSAPMTASMDSELELLERLRAVWVESYSLAEMEKLSGLGFEPWVCELNATSLATGTNQKLCL
ncbi:hypothetical protein VNO77_22715 [Canavalia gladiata]|uniref:Uncharacterized protein n=1 Tax=Canavalia gladiata TaxID=3824 RepID=A0AAN9L3A1_CANGL